MANSSRPDMQLGQQAGAGLLHMLNKERDLGDAGGEGGGSHWLQKYIMFYPLYICITNPKLVVMFEYHSYFRASTSQDSQDTEATHVISMCCIGQILDSYGRLVFGRYTSSCNKNRVQLQSVYWCVNDTYVCV